jgi:hypothetical protein
MSEATLTPEELEQIETVYANNAGGRTEGVDPLVIYYLVNVVPRLIATVRAARAELAQHAALVAAAREWQAARSALYDKPLSDTADDYQCEQRYADAIEALVALAVQPAESEVGE